MVAVNEGSDVGETMTAARFHAVGEPLSLEEVPRPEPAAGEVLVRVEAAGVCGTELHFVDGLLTPAHVPMTLGHEVAGVIDEVGPYVGEFRAGDRVAVQYFHPCGTCRFCRSGRENICEQPLGFLAFATDGGFADYVRVPASALVRVPAGLSAAQAAPLCCSATTALHASSIADLRAGDTAVVYGIGGVGLALVQVLVHFGVRVVAVGRSAEKLRTAESYGAESTVDASGGRVAERVRERIGGADAVFELVGTAESGREALGCVDRGGALVCIGYSFDRIPLDLLELVVPEQRILTSVSNTRRELERALELAAAGVLSPAVAGTAPLSEVNDVLDRLRDGKVTGRFVLAP